MWHGNHLSKASSPAARLLQRQRLNLETHMRAKHLGTNEDIESSETTGNKQSKDLLNENLESSESTIADSIAGELFPPRIVVHCRQNNIFLAVCQANGLPLKFWSSGMLGYKNAMKTTQKAALALMDTLYDYLAEKSITKVRLEFKGVNTARQVILSQFRKNGLAITHVIDTTPIPNGGGPRPKKARRL